MDARTPFVHLPGTVVCRSSAKPLVPYSNTHFPGPSAALQQLDASPDAAQQGLRQPDPTGESLHAGKRAGSLVSRVTLRSRVCCGACACTESATREWLLVSQ